MSDTNTVELAAAITAAWLENSNNHVVADKVAPLLSSVAASLSNLSDPQPEAQAEPTYSPAVTVRKSLASKDHIVSMIDGKPYRILKRHLSANGLTPAEYRARYGLKADYPMTAPAYSATRSEAAKARGFGRKPVTPAKMPREASGRAKPSATKKPAKAAVARPEAAREGDEQ